jgi:hypothetical protein
VSPRRRLVHEGAVFEADTQQAAAEIAIRVDREAIVAAVGALGLDCGCGTDGCPCRRGFRDDVLALLRGAS